MGVHEQNPNASKSTAQNEIPPQPGLDQKTLENWASDITQALTEVDQQRQSMLDEMRQMATEIGLTAAAKLTFKSRDELPSDYKPVVEAIVKNLSDSALPAVDCAININDQDYESLMNAQSDPNDAIGKLKITSDSRLQPGDCRIETNSETLVSNLRLKLSEIRQSLLESLHDAEIERRNPQGDYRKLRRFPDRRSTG